MRVAYSTLVLQVTIGALAAPTALPKDIVTGAAASVSDVATVGFATENGGTSGGKGGKTVRVSSLEQLQAAAGGAEPAIVMVTGPIKGNAKVVVGSNKSIIGAGPQASLDGVGLFIKGQKNIIVRNLKISKVQAKAGDAIGVQSTKNVWIDHVDVSSDQDHGKDYYDGLIDLTHATDFVTVSNSKIHDHMKGSLIGHSDKNEAEDKGHLRVTMFNNYWLNVHSRAPSLRFGTAHIFDSVFVNVVDGINVRKGAQALVENDSFTNSTQPLYSVDETGGAVQKQNDFGSVAKVVKAVKQGVLNAVPYKYSAQPIAGAREAIVRNAGVTLRF